MENEIKKLIEEYVKTKDDDLLRGVIDYFKPIIHKQVNKFGFDEDMEQQVITELCIKWIYKLKYNYKNYIKSQVIGYLKQYKRDNINFLGLSRTEQEQYISLFKKENLTPEEQTLKHKLAGKIANIESMTTQVNEEDEEIIKSDVCDYNNWCNEENKREMVEEIKNILTPEEFELLCLYAVDCKTYQEISSIYGTSKQWIHQRIKEIKNKVKEKVSY